MSKLEQRVARAIYEQEDANECKRDPGSATLGPFDKFPEHWKEDYRLIAKAALAQLRLTPEQLEGLASGDMVVRPRNATQDMCKAGASAIQAEIGDAEVCWDTMVNTK